MSRSKHSLKIIAAFCKYDYGIKSRGAGLEYSVAYPALKANAKEVIPFWLDENGYPDDLNALQKNLIKFCEQHNPDIVFFVLMNDEIGKSTIYHLSKKYFTVNWFCDDQWRFDNFSKHIAPALTHIVTVDKYSVDKYQNLGCKNIILTQWATYNYKDNLSLENIEHKYDVSFVGSKNLVRAWYISFLKRKGIFINCFGSGWSGDRITYDEMQEIMLKSKINLNLSNSTPKDIRFYFYILTELLKKLFSFKLYKFYKLLKSFAGLLLHKKNIEQIKARNFEIPGLGGFQLSQYALEIEDYYRIGQEIAVFATPDELYRQIKYYQSNEQERIKILKNGYEKTKNYTYENRYKSILNEISNETCQFSSNKTISKQ